MNGRITIKSYVYGFIGSLLLTFGAYSVGVRHSLSRWWLIGVLVGLALVQFILQLVSFLHLGKDKRRRWDWLVFIFMVGTVLIIVLGSLWIMSNLNYHMSLQQQYQYLNNQGDGI